MLAAKSTNLEEARVQQDIQSRVRVSWKVRAITSHTGSFVTCVVQDVSPGGARLSVPSGATLPDRFQLRFPLRDTACDVAVRWRGDGEVGVAFIDADNASLPSAIDDGEPNILGNEPQAEQLAGADLSYRMRRLEAEIVELTSAVARLEGALKARLLIDGTEPSIGARGPELTVVRPHP